MRLRKQSSYPVTPEGLSFGAVIGHDGLVIATKVTRPTQTLEEVRRELSRGTAGFDFKDLPSVIGAETWLRRGPER